MTVAWDGLNLAVLVGGEHPRGTIYLLSRGLTVGINPDNGRPSGRDQVATWYGAILLMTNPPISCSEFATIRNHAGMNPDIFNTVASGDYARRLNDLRDPIFDSAITRSL